MTSDSKWEEVAAKRQATLSEQIPLEYRIPPNLLPPTSQLDVTGFPRESGWFSQQELEITESSATTILNQIATQTWSAEDVAKAFCKRAAAAHQLVSRYEAFLTYTA